MTTASTWHMPAETGKQARTWMAWPVADYGTTAEEARRAWSAVANAIIEHGGQPVTMLVTADEEPYARKLLDDKVTLLVTRLDDGWARDTGPTFVVDAQRKHLGAVDWVFNAWGAQEWASWAWDARVATTIAGEAHAEIIPSEMVAEGGGFHTDGEGTFLVTETVMLDPYRNLGWTRDRVETHFRHAFGDCKLIWLPRGLTRDYDRFGTRGHVDLITTFTEPTRLLVHSQGNAQHPDHEVSQRTIALLKQATDFKGRQLTVTEVPAPKTLHTPDGGWTDYSYINHVVCNDAVIACNFADDADHEANEILHAAYQRPVVPVDARPLFARGGGAHCITQQEPAIG
ncbi:agmatine/peptidylarginine deiminase [Kitasatospora sp. NPDC096204]|uniref:agmatine deiminase family protein n=1 Tax=Kitasatospora sp. NPDC096204 TaxID=3364094 RepID=UPI00380B87EA